MPVWGVLILPFVGVYTINLTDVQYVRPVLGILFTLIVFMQNVRIPGLTIICAAGHYKETRYQAILEAVINITVSLGLVWKFGMAGVLLGTVCSYGYRSFEIVFYTSRHLVKRMCKKIHVSNFEKMYLQWQFFVRLEHMLFRRK